MGDHEKKLEFSKSLLVQESVLIWIITLSYILLAYVAVLYGYTGSLPWLSVIPGLAWTAYGVSQGFYYNKAKAENTKDGIKFESVMEELKLPNYQDFIGDNIDYNQFIPEQEEAIDLDYGI